VDYDPFIKRQLASTQLTSGPDVVQIWSRNPGKKTFVVHRVDRLYLRPKAQIGIEAPLSLEENSQGVNSIHSYFSPSPAMSPPQCPPPAMSSPATPPRASSPGRDRIPSGRGFIDAGPFEAAHVRENMSP